MLCTSSEEKDRERERGREGGREGESVTHTHLFLEDVDWYSSIFVCLQFDDLQPCHLCAGCVGSVGGLWYETDLPMLLPSVPVVGHDGT